MHVFANSSGRRSWAGPARDGGERVRLEYFRGLTGPASVVVPQGTRAALRGAAVRGLHRRHLGDQRARRHSRSSGGDAAAAQHHRREPPRAARLAGYGVEAGDDARAAPAPARPRGSSPRLPAGDHRRPGRALTRRPRDPRLAGSAIHLGPIENAIPFVNTVRRRRVPGVTGTIAAVLALTLSTGSATPPGCWPTRATPPGTRAHGTGRSRTWVRATARVSPRRAPSVRRSGGGAAPTHA